MKIKKTTITALLLGVGLLAQPPYQAGFKAPVVPWAIFDQSLSCLHLAGGATSTGCSNIYSPTSSEASATEITALLPDSLSNGPDGIYLRILWGNRFGGTGTSVQWNVQASCSDQANLTNFYTTPNYGSTNQVTFTVPPLNSARLDFILIPQNCLTQRSNVLRIRLWNTGYSAGGPSTFNGYIWVSALAVGIRQ